MADYPLISDQPLVEQTLRDAVAGDDAGAMVSFHGVVRDHDHGRSVTSLGYSAHPTAAAELAASCARIEQQFTGVRVAASHRIGALQIGDSALIAVAASAHRAEAFAACGALVDDIKQHVPIWKNQHFTDGTSEWVGAGS